MRRRWAYFWAQDFTCAPADISQLLQLAPTSVRVAGQTVLSNGRVADSNDWRLESGLGDDALLHAHIEEVLGKVAGRLPELRSRVQPITCGLNCVTYADEHQGNGYHLSADLIGRLARHGLSVDFDLYGGEGK
jgi:hypothetical protein